MNGKLIGIIIAIIIAIVIVVIVSVILFPQTSIKSSPPVQQPSPTESTSPIASTMPTVCNALDNGVLPDATCTPGAIDPRVTQDNIGSTICVPGYTKTVRPPVSVTEPQKLEGMTAYGFNDSPSNYEFDHLIPLEIGGAPDDIEESVANLMIPHPSSFDKDGLENYLT